MVHLDGLQLLVAKNSDENEAADRRTYWYFSELSIHLRLLTNKQTLPFADIGYGNYLLTAPVERKQRKLWKNDASEESVTKHDVSELLSSSNTLTNPKSTKKSHIEL